MNRFCQIISTTILFIYCFAYFITADVVALPSQHGVALMGKLKYPGDFKHFDYVNPDAPKGGHLRMATTAVFNTLNIAVLKGTLPPGLHLIYDTLTVSSLDESFSEYGRLASSISYPEDISFVRYNLRANARWHDGKPVTADDVIFSLNTLKKLHPGYKAYYQDVVGVKKLGDLSVEFELKQSGNRELPLIIGHLLILPKHWWQMQDASGKQRDITASTMVPTLGSGPYRIKNIVSGRRIIYERVKDYWGKNLPVMRGQHNFDTIQYEVYRDDSIAFEAFKADLLDWRVENKPKRWVDGYDFPAGRKGFIKLEKFPKRGYTSMQAYVFNLRRDKFKDPRVRHAFNLAFNFEAINKSLFHNQYKRIDSYFPGTELASSGLPQAEELRLLEPLRDLVPPQLFITPYNNPSSGDYKTMRVNLRTAYSLLQEAGWKVHEGRLVNVKTGEPMIVEFLLYSPQMQRVTLLYKPWLEKLGITVKVRSVNHIQYINLVRNFDFDIIMKVWPQSLSPGNEQRNYFGSLSADRPGSQNIGGVKNPAIDKLIERLIFAKSRKEIITTTRALDRVLLWNHYVVPQYIIPDVQTARWDRFSHPDALPFYYFGFPEIWWWNKVKAKAIHMDAAQ